MESIYQISLADGVYFGTLNRDNVNITSEHLSFKVDRPAPDPKEVYMVLVEVNSGYAKVGLRQGLWRVKEDKA